MILDLYELKHVYRLYHFYKRSVKQSDGANAKHLSLHMDSCRPIAIIRLFESLCERHVYTVWIQSPYAARKFLSLGICIFSPLKKTVCFVEALTYTCREDCENAHVVCHTVSNFSRRTRGGLGQQPAPPLFEQKFCYFRAKYIPFSGKQQGKFYSFSWIQGFAWEYKQVREICPHYFLDSIQCYHCRIKN